MKMTKDEALEVIKLHPFLFASFPDDVLEALDVLIKLEQEPQTFKWCTDCREYDQEKHCCHRWSKVIRDTVEEMKQEPRWISVSERLPEPDVEVLVTDDAGGLATINTDSIYKSEVTGKKKWYTSQNVTAWMPLPKAYSEDKK